MVEAFTFPGIKQAAANLQIKLIGVKCDAYGLNPQALEAAISNHDVRYLVCTPNLQNPTGVTMDTVRRRQIADIVERTQMTLIEDDVYGSFTNQPPLSAETKGDHFCVSSLSKCVTPGLRFGFVTGSCDALAGLKQEVSMTSWLVAPFMLTLATKLIESGKAMDAANNQKALIQARSDMAVKIFGKKLDGPATHLWLETPYDSEAFSDFIYAKGIKVLPSTNFRVGRGGKTHIRVSLSADISNSELAWSLNLIAQNGAKLT
ncbi:MAG: DNA-binding transcriptional MocR family regulator [Yoonia sp.]